MDQHRLKSTSFFLNVKRFESFLDCKIVVIWFGCCCCCCCHGSCYERLTDGWFIFNSIPVDSISKSTSYQRWIDEWMNSVMSLRLIVCRWRLDLFAARRNSVDFHDSIICFWRKKVFCNRNLDLFKYIVEPSVEVLIIYTPSGLVRCSVFGNLLIFNREKKKKNDR